jgi:hypothetical protein
MVEELLSKRGSAGSGVFTNDLSANGRQQLEGKFLAVNVPQPHFQVCVRVVVGVSKASIRSGEMRPLSVAVVPVISVGGSDSPKHPARRRPTARSAAAVVISAPKNWEAIRTLTTRSRPRRIGKRSGPSPRLPEIRVPEDTSSVSAACCGQARQVEAPEGIEGGAPGSRSSCPESHLGRVRLLAAGAKRIGNEGRWNPPSQCTPGPADPIQASAPKAASHGHPRGRPRASGRESELVVVIFGYLNHAQVPAWSLVTPAINTQLMKMTLQLPHPGLRREPFEGQRSFRRGASC